MSSSRQFSDEDDITGVDFIDQDYHQFTKRTADHPRLLVDIHKCNNVTPSYLMMDLALKNMSGVAYAQDSVIYVIVNGILEYHDDVPLSVG